MKFKDRNFRKAIDSEPGKFAYKAGAKGRSKKDEDRIEFTSNINLDESRLEETKGYDRIAELLLLVYFLLI